MGSSSPAGAGAGAGAAGAGAPPALTLVADSTRAPPLEIDIDAGAWQPAAHERRAGAPAPTLLGLRAAVRGTTVFRVLRADARDGDADIGRLVCVYTRHVAALPACVALDAAAADAADDDADAGAGADADADAAAIDLARFEAVRGVRASDDEVAAMLAGAVAAAATRASDGGERTALPPLARQLFDAGDEGFVCISFEDAEEDVETTS
jgi:hypothetical protein